MANAYHLINTVLQNIANTRDIAIIAYTSRLMGQNPAVNRVVVVDLNIPRQY